MKTKGIDSYKKMMKYKELFEKYQHFDRVSPALDICHYTDINGLRGIIRDDPKELGKLHFWFTRSDCLNDSSEGIYAIKLFNRVCDQLFNDGNINKDYYEGLKNIDVSEDVFFYATDEANNRGRLGVDALEKTKSVAYICCFSLNDDSLDMWRYYSKGNGGYSITIAINAFTQKNYVGKIEHFHCYEVIYDKQKQEELMRGLILDSIDCFQNYPNEKDALKSALVFVRSVLKEFQFLFKHECFASEKEFRCLWLIPKDRIKAALNDQFEICFRNSSGKLIPYIDYELKNSMIYIKEIKISPFLRKSSAKEIVEEYIKKCGLDNVTVTVSDLPVRVD